MTEASKKTPAIENIATPDAELEQRIDVRYRCMVVAPNPEVARVHFLAMVELVRQRSPEQIGHMERERRLCASKAS